MQQGKTAAQRREQLRKMLAAIEGSGIVITKPATATATATATVEIEMTTLSEGKPATVSKPVAHTVTPWQRALAVATGEVDPDAAAPGNDG